eukprot:TRINITY_DN18982_c0_g1_i1.p1 TRINITY_DN18982_c0_g1~~TRINITY_DN18982_c0_g1_i1.p1  ORF type:complete len:242 (+),score=63.04 TRINITY_DN18982_c0_g1_i1:173-898(+)
MLAQHPHQTPPQQQQYGHFPTTLSTSTLLSGGQPSEAKLAESVTSLGLSLSVSVSANTLPPLTRQRFFTSRKSTNDGQYIATGGIAGFHTGGYYPQPQSPAAPSPPKSGKKHPKAEQRAQKLRELQEENARELQQVRDRHLQQLQEEEWGLFLWEEEILRDALERQCAAVTSVLYGHRDARVQQLRAVAEAMAMLAERERQHREGVERAQLRDSAAVQTKWQAHRALHSAAPATAASATAD